MDSGLRYADYFIDNIWTDWAVMDHINRAQEQAKQTAGKLSRVKSQLSDMQRETEAKMKALRKDIEDTAFQTARQ